MALTMAMTSSPAQGASKPSPKPVAKPAAKPVPKPIITKVAAAPKPAETTVKQTPIVVAMATDPVSLNPLEQRVIPTFSVVRNMYDPLIDVDDTGRALVPSLATAWSWTTPTQLTLTLRSGVKFTDGSSFGADDVVYTINAMNGKIPGSKVALVQYIFTTVTSAEAKETNQVVINVSKATPRLPFTLANLLIIPNKSLDAGSTLAAKPNGTGAYDFVRYVPQKEVVMNAKPGYFLGNAAIPTVTFRTIPDVTSRLFALSTGEVDMVSGLLPSQTTAVHSGTINKLVSVPSLRMAAIWFNTLETPALKSKEVRQALNYAVDREGIVKGLFQGRATVTNTVVPQFFTGANASLKPYAYDPAKAKKMLADAGYPNGFNMTILVPSARYIMGVEATQAVASQLNAVGVKATINEVPFADFASLTAARKIPEAMFASYGGVAPDPLQLFQVCIRSGGGFSWYKNADFDALVDKAAGATDEATYISSLSNAEAIISDDPPFIFLYANNISWGLAKNLNFNPLSTEIINLFKANWTK
ncbi:MAG: hypothetical protein D4R44_06620 [Actinobacteria bacterium]|nr:MAG: hypothetical protein D4R44_06620 [Actinomycetota bacterium]